MLSILALKYDFVNFQLTKGGVPRTLDVKKALNTYDSLYNDEENSILSEDKCSDGSMEVKFPQPLGNHDRQGFVLIALMSIRFAKKQTKRRRRCS